MGKLRKYNLMGEEIGEVELAEEFIQTKVSSQQVKDYIVALRANARQWSARAQIRSEVNHSNKKPHRQKGTGRARQGSLAAPHFRGGGVVHGPRPKFKQHVRINQKERRQVVKALIGEKAQADSLMVLEEVELERPSTKTLAQFLKAVGLEKRVLFLVGDASTPVAKNFSRSLANLKGVELSPVANANGYQLVKCHALVLTESALNQLNQTARGAS